ncbi:DNA ligase [Candidatus Bathyarchaeota archaeon]|nr:DNA ligase [Candidatus Bathyarchaeota archaeon]
MEESDKLEDYREKRDFNESPEPEGKEENPSGNKPIYVIQKHDASNLHYDLRLESEGVLKSWAVPKGPSMDPDVKRLAIPTEDHPIEYAEFEGVIPEGHYGAGTVIVWDYGNFENTKQDKSFEETLEDGHSTVRILGEKLKGDFALIRTGKGDNPRWLFFKMKGEEAKSGSEITEEQPNSVKTGRSLEKVMEEEEPADIEKFG